MKKKSGIILALDVAGREDAIRISKEIGGIVDAIKIGYPLVLSTGMDIIDEISKFSDVICDFKVADIPNTNRLIAEQVFRHKAEALIVHGFAGADSVKACIDVAHPIGKKIFMVTEMTHPGAAEFMAQNVEKLAELAKQVNADGVIAPATRPEKIKKVREIVGDMLVLSPGVGAQGGKACEAIKNGADYIIVGRQIYQAPDPKTEAKKLAEEVQSVRYH